MEANSYGSKHFSLEKHNFLNTFITKKDNSSMTKDCILFPYKAISFAEHPKLPLIRDSAIAFYVINNSISKEEEEATSVLEYED